MELATAIEIKGQQIIQKPLTANHFLEYEKRKINQGIAIANEWLIYEACGDIDLSKLRFRDRGKLLTQLTSTKIGFNDDLPISESSDFTVSGNRFTEKEASGDVFDQFVVKAAKDSLGAYKWAIPRVLLINSEEITEGHFDKTAPDGIGFEAMGVIIQWLSSFLS